MKSNTKNNIKSTANKNAHETSPLPTVSPLTSKEKMILEFIENTLAEKGISPSFQEIRDHFGFASFNSVQNYIKQLTNKEYIQVPNNQKRAIQVLRPSSAAQSHVHNLKSVSQSPRESLLQKTTHEEIFSLPLLGRVAAGKPIEAVEHDEYIDIPPSMVRNPSKSFALKVEGDSMIEDGIFNGDIILVQKQNSASNGEIVVATVESDLLTEATVKRLYSRAHPDSGEKLVELRPSNSKMQTMWFHPSQVKVQGVVVGLIRKF